MRFEFATAARIVFGSGTIREAGKLAREFGQRALVVTGKDSQRSEPLLARLRQASIAPFLFPTDGEPDLRTVEAGVEAARREGCQLVVAMGGGSALDAGKAIAAMLTNPGALLDYLEVVGHGKPMAHVSAPLLAVPTTAGTGSEVTRNAVLASPQHKVKVSLRSAGMLPRVALVDPELTHDLPAALTASTGLDALTQLIEPYVSPRANPITDALCAHALPRAARALRVAVAQPANSEAREAMSVASLYGGLALANAGLGAVHGFAGPIGGAFPAAHGAVCAALLAPIMRANLSALRARAPGHESLNRYQHVARWLTGNPAAEADEGAVWMAELVAELGIPPLRKYGIGPAHFSDLIEKASHASSMKANPIMLTTSEMLEALEQAT